LTGELTVIDLCTRRIVGWSLARHLRAGLVGDALKQALQTRRPAAGLVFHSDRGSQYGSGEYRSLLDRAGAVQSMSARANPYHNAWTESFMSTLKGEMLQGGCFAGERDARTEIFDFHRRLLQHAPQTLVPRPVNSFELRSPPDSRVDGECRG
jgi:putative transposase